MTEIESGENLREPSQGMAETAESNEAVGSGAVLSPEKSLFGNSANMLRKSDMEAIIANNDTGSNGVNGSDDKKESNGNHKDEPNSAAENSETVIEDNDEKNKSQSSILSDAKESEGVPMDVSISEEDNEQKNGSTEVIEDKAGEEECIRREVTPLTEKEAYTAVEPEVDIVPAESEEHLEESGKIEPVEEEAPTSVRRSSRRSAATTPQAKTTPKATTKATPKSTKANKSVVNDKEESEVDQVMPSKDDATAQEETTSTRRSLRTPRQAAVPKASPKAKTSATAKSKKAEASTEEPEKLEESPSGRRKSARGAAKKEEAERTTLGKAVKPASKTPRSTKKNAAVEDEENMEVEEAEAETPKKSPAKKVKKEEDEEKVTPRRASGRGKATKTPIGKTPKQAKKESEDVEMESEKEEEEMEEEKPMKGKKTPKRPPLKRSAVTDKKEPKAKRRNNSEPSDPTDPFNFDAKQDEHPELFKSVQVERQSFGGLKFFKSPAASSTSKYASMEKNASERRINMPEADAVPTPGSSKAKTPRKMASAKKSSAKKGKATEGETAPIEFEDSADEKVETKATPKPKAKRGGADTAVVKTPKVQEKAPELTAEEQVQADDASNPHYPPGARVFAIWGKEYYSAVVADIDGLGRYKVFYTEDQSIRNIPKAGVIPLHLVHEGCEVSALGEKDDDGERLIYEGRVLSVPDSTDPASWESGMYNIELSNDEHPDPEAREIPWADIFFTEAQYKKIIKKIKNPTTVDTENVIDNKRRTRRSTAATPTVPPAVPTDAPSDNNKAATAMIFKNLQFLLTSANRNQQPPPFPKREVKRQIEARGGKVVESFNEANPEWPTYLIADTFYRTHKYLTALSLSIPTVSFKWIDKCVEENKLVDYNDFMLDAGESDTDGEIFKWKPLKGRVLAGKSIALFTNNPPPEEFNKSFAQIWAPIIQNLGGSILDVPDTWNEVHEFFKYNRGAADCLMIEDETAQASSDEIAKLVKESGVKAVSSEWLINSIVTASVAPMSGSERYILPAPSQS